MAQRYATRDEAIQLEIIEPIENGDAAAADYDVEAIAQVVLGDGYARRIGLDEFWRVVAENEL